MERGHEVRAAFRLLLRYGNRACEHRHPHRKILHAYLRAKFRDSESELPAPRTLANTVRFVQAAAEHTGLERRCIATMIHVEHGRYERARLLAKSSARAKREKPADDFNAALYASVIDNLNRTADLCL